MRLTGVSLNWKQVLYLFVTSMRLPKRSHSKASWLLLFARCIDLLWRNESNVYRPAGPFHICKCSCYWFTIFYYKPWVCYCTWLYLKKSWYLLKIEKCRLDLTHSCAGTISKHNIPSPTDAGFWYIQNNSWNETDSRSFIQILYVCKELYRLYFLRVLRTLS
jgi:hypothetical protein